MIFDLQPELTGEKVHLRPLRRGDYDELYAVASDPLIWKQHPQQDRYKPAQFKKYFEDSINSKGALVIFDRHTTKIIGSSRFHGLDLAANEIEIGWTFLARIYWGGEYNKEVKMLMLQHAFHTVEHVILLISPNNHRSRKAAEKIGAIASGERKNSSNQVNLVYRFSARDYA